MDSNNELFQVEFTEEYIEEMTEIYDYISIQLKNDNVAIQLITKVNEKILKLANTPEIYMKIGKVDKLKMEYHRMFVNNFVILYTIDYNKKKVYVSRIIYGRRNYFN